MLSYQHVYHAGNVADVHKHLVLWHLLDALLARPKPFVVLDLYAGSGLYPLKEGPAARAQEWREGIGSLWRAGLGAPHSQVKASQTTQDGRSVRESSASAALLAYLQAVAQASWSGQMANAPDTVVQQPRHATSLSHYPGSPWLVVQRLRADDRYIGCELHPGAYAELRGLLAGDARCHVHRRDAREAVKGLLPPQPRRGLLLLDPAYERLEEYAEVVQMLRTIRQRWTTGSVMLWYPLLSTGHDARLREGVVAAQAGAGVVFSELRLSDPPRGPGLQGSGVAVIGPPWQFAESLRQTLQILPSLGLISEKGGIFQAEVLENQQHRPQFYRI